MIGVSIAGGVFHNVGQLIIASLIVETFSVMYYFPVLLVAGLVTGLFDRDRFRQYVETAC